MKLKRSRSDRILMENGLWGYHADCTPEDVDDSPEYFDEIVHDVIDAEKYAQYPLAAGVGTTFVLFLGDMKGVYHKGYFEVDAVDVETNEHGIKLYHLVWYRSGEWRRVDVKRRIADRLSPVSSGGEDRPEPDEPIKRGPGRPRNDEHAAA